MAASFSGKHLLLLLLLLLIVSLCSSSRAVGKYSFNKFSRATGRLSNEKTEQVQTQPDFYPDSENPHGLSTNTPPPPHTYTYTPPPPPPSHKNSPPWLPKNYNKYNYVTDRNEVSPFMYQEEIIEEEKKDLPTSTTQSNSDQFEEEELDTTELDDFSDNKYTHSSSHAESEEEQQTVDQPPKKKTTQQRQGMSDTRFMENGMYAFNVKTNSFSSEEHPYKQINNRNTKAKTTHFHKYNDPTGKTDAYAKQKYREEFQTDDDDEQP